MQQLNRNRWRSSRQTVQTQTACSRGHRHFGRNRSGQITMRTPSVHRRQNQHPTLPASASRPSDRAAGGKSQPTLRHGRWCHSREPATGTPNQRARRRSHRSPLAVPNAQTGHKGAPARRPAHAGWQCHARRLSNPVARGRKVPRQFAISQRRCPRRPEWRAYPAIGLIAHGQPVDDATWTEKLLDVYHFSA